MEISIFGELRASEKKTSTKGDYILIHGEDRTGTPFHVFSRNVRIVENVQKGSDCEFVADLSISTKFSSLELKQINVL